MRKEEDADAIRRCQRGDISGLEPLVRSYQTQALRVAYLIVANRQLAEDIVQDSFLMAYSHITQFDIARPFGPWFYRIVLNTARQSQRQQTRRPTLRFPTEHLDGEEHPDWEELSDSSGQYDPAVQAEQTLESTALLHALAALTVKQRSAIVLHYYCDFTVQEIAQMLNCLPGTVRWRLHSGLHALKNIIQKESPWLMEKQPVTTKQANVVALPERGFTDVTA